MTVLLEFALLVLLSCSLLYLLRIARALEAMVPPQEDDAPFDYHAAEVKQGGRRRSALYNANKDLHLPE